MLAFTIYALTNPKSDTQRNSVYIPPLIGLMVGALIATLAPLTQAGCKSFLRDTWFDKFGLISHLTLLVVELCANSS
jgi:hypothetical protein